jgi:aminocarboxymuconate-semialdehyde decarboxylase
MSREQAETGPAAGAIDFHAHVVVPEVYELTRPHSLFARALDDPLATADIREKIAARAERVNRQMADVDERVAAMDAMGVAVQVLTASIVHHRTDWAEPEQSLALERRLNDRIGEIVARRPDRFAGLGGVPLHAPALAAAELERCVKELGLKGVQISTTAREMELGDPRLRPFWATADELGAVVFVHPAGNPDPRFACYQLWNSIGQSFEEAMAIASLFYNGVLDEFPRLRVCISHGGGYMPFYMGRITRNYLEKPATRVHMRRSPDEYLRMLYFDTCLYEASALEQLVKRVGADRVVLGSDYPVGEMHPVEFVRGVRSLSADSQQSILRGNAAQLLGF